jgi:hypothetical protein
MKEMPQPNKNMNKNMKQDHEEKKILEKYRGHNGLFGFAFLSVRSGDDPVFSKKKEKTECDPDHDG